MSELLATIEIPKFITKVQMAKKRRKKYYRKKDGNWKPRDLPPTYQEKLDSGDWSMDKRNKYILDKDGNKVCANPQAAGTPRYEVLSGNKLLSGYGSPHTRARLTRALKDFYRPFVQKYIIENGKLTKFPLRVTWDIYTTVEDEANWDVFNLFFYYKYFEDSLHERTDEDKSNPIRYKGNDLLQLIPDDSVLYITWPPGPKIIPVDEWDQRKFTFRFFHDGRNELKREPWI